MKIVIPMNEWEISHLSHLKSEILFLLEDRFPDLKPQIEFGPKLEVPDPKVKKEIVSFLFGEEDNE